MAQVVSHDLRFATSFNTSSVYMGSNYGGFSCLPHLLSEDSLIYSFGIGTDVSWDLALMARIRCHVHAFDNSPASNAWFEHLMAGKSRRIRPSQLEILRTHFHRHPMLLGTMDANMSLRRPKGFTASYASVQHATARGFRSRDAPWAVPARTLQSIRRLLNHSTRTIDVLKMDVEGAEFDIISGWRSAHQRIPACQLLIEWHARLVPAGETAKTRAVADLAALGFQLLHTDYQAAYEGDNALFVNPSICRRREQRAQAPTTLTGLPQTINAEGAGAEVSPVAHVKLTLAQCTALLQSTQMASMWGSVEARGRNKGVQPRPNEGQPSSMPRRGLPHRYVEPRRRPGERACFADEGADFFKRAAEGTHCKNSSWFDFSTPAQKAKTAALRKKLPMAALLGSLPDMVRLCQANSMRLGGENNNRMRAPNYQRFGLVCELARFHILMLWRDARRPWTMCVNHEWMMCAVRGLLPSQRGNEIVFATKPSKLRTNQLKLHMDMYSFDGSLVFFQEVCLLASICDNSQDDLFTVRTSTKGNDRAFRCKFNYTKYQQLEHVLRGTDRLFS